MDNIFTNLNEDQLNFQQEAVEYCANEIGPYINDVDQGKMEIWDVIRPMGKKGYIGISFPKRMGGLSKTLMHELIFTEAVCYHSLPVDMSRFASTYPALLIRMFGKTRHLRHYVDPLVKGEKIGCFCFTEPDAGSDLSRMKTIYEKDEKNNEFILNGEKRFITNGSIADTLVVYGRNGSFIIDSSWEGFEVIEEYQMMGLHGLHLGHMKFNNIRVPAENKLFFKEIKTAPSGERQSGKTSAISGMQAMLGPERVVVSVQALAVARRAIEVAIEYSKQRVQFKRPICEFEGVNFKVANMVTNYEAGKALIEKAVNNLEDGHFAAIAKLFACQQSYYICDDAIQILGGIGYTNKYPVERCARDVRLLRIGAGTDEIMKYVIQKGIYRKSEKIESLGMPKSGQFFSDEDDSE
jgi:alkylation response protein AidB-like acyl-CoA dehydrogenase